MSPSCQRLRSLERQNPPPEHLPLVAVPIAKACFEIVRSLTMFSSAVVLAEKKQLKINQHEDDPQILHQTIRAGNFYGGSQVSLYVYTLHIRYISKAYMQRNQK